MNKGWGRELPPAAIDTTQPLPPELLSDRPGSPNKVGMGELRWLWGRRMWCPRHQL